MPETILVAAAWPYANGPLHLGHVAGCYLPADTFARFHRALGNRVLFVSGSDQHGTPVTVRAEAEGLPPAEIAQRYHESFLESWQQLGVAWDIYTRTGTENHQQVVHRLFSTLREKDYIFQGTMETFYCPQCVRFLPDRYVEGVCPYCGSPSRGDQCEECGKPISAGELPNPVCRICGSTPRLTVSEHFFFDLRKFNERLLEWAQKQVHWKSNVRSFTLNLLREGLQPRPITRDLEWGISVPVAGFGSKRIYVWFEAVIGYLSASMEWAARQGAPEAWREWWSEGARSYYFIGKDNIWFHTLIWPAMLMGYGGLVLPYDVPANEYLTLEHRQLSTSRNWAIWVPDFMSRYDADPLRYMLSANAPETADSDFSWREFVRRNNDELVAAYGNLVHRTLTLTYRNFGGEIPAAGEPGEPDRAVLERAAATFETATGLLRDCRFKAAIGEIMALAREGNRYFDSKAPWKQVKEDLAAAAVTLNTCIQLLGTLRTLFYPFLPHSSQRLHEMLGGEQPLAEGRGIWKLERIPAGRPLAEPQPLFRRLDDSVADEELARLQGGAQ